MIKIISTELKTGVKIKVVGRVRQFVIYIGESGGTVSRGRYVGQERKSVAWGHPLYCNSLRQALELTQNALSEMFDIPPEDQDIDGIEGWELAIQEQEKLFALSESIGEQFKGFIDKYGDLAKDVGSQMEKDDADDDESDDDAEEPEDEE